MSLKDKEKVAIERLKAFVPDDELGYSLQYSGGKDSDAIRILAKMAGVKHTIDHNVTSVDAPETMRYIRSIPDVILHHEYYEDGTAKTMWNLIPRKKTPPTRIIRYCCEQLKEYGGKGRVCIVGVRWDESTRRKESAGVVKIIGKPKTTQKTAQEMDAEYRVTKQGGLVLNNDNDASRRMVEYCYRTTKTMVNPIVDWTEQEVWEFLHHYGCEGNPLYQCGNHRVGCIGCPMRSKGRYKEFERYPKYKENYMKAFARMLQEREKAGIENRMSWNTPEDVFRWWMEEEYDTLQMAFDFSE